MYFADESMITDKLNDGSLVFLFFFNWLFIFVLILEIFKIYMKIFMNLILFFILNLSFYDVEMKCGSSLNKRIFQISV